MLPHPGISALGPQNSKTQIPLTDKVPRLNLHLILGGIFKIVNVGPIEM